MIFLSLAIVVILATANGPTAFQIVKSLENDFPPVSIEDTPKADAIIVLGGGLSLPLPPRIYADMNGGTDRLFRGFQLYQSGKAGKIILTGGNVFPEPEYEGEAYYASEILQQWGIPADAIIMEPQSRNTLQNAEYTKRILEQKGFKKVLLVTSARHMHRALLAFKTAGIDAVPIPVDFSAVETNSPTILGFVPSAGAMNWTTSSLKEYIGRIWYEIRPWIKGE